MPSDGASAAAGGRASVMLAAAGVLAGLGLVLFGLWAPPRSLGPGGDVIARVNGRPISAQHFYQLALGLNDERRAGGRPLLARSAILERLIEEELFLDRAVALGLPYSDKIARGYLINSLLAMVTHEALSARPSPEQLERFYRENLPWFTPARQAAVKLVFVAQGDEEGRTRAEGFRRAWEELPPGRVEPLDALPIPVPESLVPVQKLADYLGRETAARIARLAVGETTPPAPWMDGWVVVRCTERSGGEPPPFQEVEAQVLEAYRHRQAEEDYRAYMREVRRAADVRILVVDP